MDSKGQPRFPLAFSREQIAGQMQSIGSIEGRARVRKVFTTAREKGLRCARCRVTYAESRPPRAGAQHGVTQERAVAVVARGCPVEAVEARLDVPPNE